MIEDGTQDCGILVDISPSGHRRDWPGKKEQSMLYAQALRALGYEERAKAVEHCGETLIMGVSPNGSKRLLAAWLCHDRLCALCQWRRSLRVGAQTSEIIDYLGQQPQHLRYVFLTLTVRSVSGEDLSDMLDRMGAAWNNMSRRVRFTHAVRGWYRATEVTHNPLTDLYHPHYHCLLAVRPSYFKGGAYIPQAEWTSLWQEAIHSAYTPVVDVRTIKGGTARAIAEAAKYAVKDGDYLYPEDWDMTVATVRTLLNALTHRRLIAYGGIMRTARRLLKQPDVDAADADLTDASAETPAGERRVPYIWHSGYRQYIQDETL